MTGRGSRYSRIAEFSARTDFDTFCSSPKSFILLYLQPLGAVRSEPGPEAAGSDRRSCSGVESCGNVEPGVAEQGSYGTQIPWKLTWSFFLVLPSTSELYLQNQVLGSQPPVVSHLSSLRASTAIEYEVFGLVDVQGCLNGTCIRKAR